MEMAERMKMKIVGDIKVSPILVRRYFETLPKDSVPFIQQQVEVQIITMQPQIDQEEIERVKGELREYTERIMSGETSFSTLALLYSEDPGSARRGGELGFMGRGQLQPEFSSVAFNLTDPEKVSKIVETEYGFHIIQLIEKKGDRINCRHILLKPRVSIDDKVRSIELLDSIRTLVVDSGLVFEAAVAQYSEDKSTVMSGGLMTNMQTGASKFEYQDLPPEIAKQIYTLAEGEVSVPFVMMDRAKNKEICAIVRLKTKREAHKANLVDDFQVIREMLEQKLSADCIEQWIRNKQKEIYVSIDPMWRGCDFQYPGWVHE
jgi:peptidyl-prolyl cis-trans isomerase SurA